MGRRLIFKGADFSGVSVDDPTISAPTFSPAAGQFQDSVSVTIASRTSGATIHYTTDDSTPTSSSPVYSSPIVLSSIGSTTIKAVAIKNGVSSSVASATYQVVDHVVDPTSVTIAGASSSTTETVQLSASVGPSGAPQGVSWEVRSGNATVDANGLVTYTGGQATTGNVVVRASAAGHSDVYAETTIQFAIALSAPVISPVHGDVTNGVTVTITAADGAAIYYTLDDSTPTDSSTLYTDPITITQPATLKAIAVKNNMTSDVATGTYTEALWSRGFYYLSTGTYNNHAGYVCIKRPIDLQGKNLYVHVKAGWKARPMTTEGDASSGAASLPTDIGSNNTTGQYGSDSVATNIPIDATTNPNGRRYLWLNLLKNATVNTGNYVAITDEELAEIQAGNMCYWDEQSGSIWD